MHLRKPLIVIILAGALAAGVWMNSAFNTAQEVSTATLLPAGKVLPELKLIDQYGSPVTAASFRGQWDLVFFGFTNCPDICPVTLQILAASIRQLQDDGVKPSPRIVLISVDPERDTPEQLGEYVAHFGNNNLGVTGELEDIEVLTAALGIYFKKQPMDGDSYSVDHSAAVLLFNPRGEFHAVFSGRHEIANFVHDLPIIFADYQ
jgi:protein SCO1/2